MRIWSASGAVLFAAALGVSGCGASSAAEPRDPTAVAQPTGDGEGEVVATQAASAAGAETVCKRERPTGSHIPRMVCRDRKDADERRERDQEFLINMSRWGYNWR
jgi:hypothetical protein